MSEEIEAVSSDNGKSLHDKRITEKKDKLNDIVITQCIICLAIAVGMLVLNIFYPELCSELIERYKHYSGQSENSIVSEFILNAAQTLGSIAK